MRMETEFYFLLIRLLGSYFTLSSARLVRRYMVPSNDKRPPERSMVGLAPTAVQLSSSSAGRRMKRAVRWQLT